MSFMVIPDFEDSQVFESFVAAWCYQHKISLACARRDIVVIYMITSFPTSVYSLDLFPHISLSSGGFLQPSFLTTVIYFQTIESEIENQKCLLFKVYFRILD